MGVPVLVGVPCSWWGFEPGKGTPPVLTTAAVIVVVVEPGFGTADPGLGTVGVDFGTPASPILDPGRGVATLGLGGTPCPCDADIFRGIGA